MEINRLFLSIEPQVQFRFYTIHTNDSRYRSPSSDKAVWAGWSADRILVGARDFSLQNTQSSSGTHTHWVYHLPSIAEVKNNSTPPYAFFFFYSRHNFVVRKYFSKFMWTLIADIKLHNRLIKASCCTWGRNSID
jgi:hypothetical protein